MKRKIKSIIRITLITLVALIIGVNVYAVNANRLAGNAVPMPFGVGAAVVLSGSMEPELSVGDLLIITRSDNYSVNDVVVYQDGGMAITHRIVSITDEGVTTRGDANNTDDAPIKLEQIKGKVVFAIPFIGYIVNATKTPIGVLCIIALAIFLLEGSFNSEKQKEQKELDAIRAEIEKLKQNEDGDY